MAKNRKTPNMNLPVWFDGQNINEALFCEEFLHERRIIFANGAFFTPDGRVTDDLPLRGEIYDKLKFCAVNNIPRKITNILEVLKLEAQVPDFPPEQDRIHLSNGNEISNRFTDDYFRYSLPAELNSSSATSPAWYGYIAAINVLGTSMLFSTAPLSKYFVLGTNGNKNSIDKHHIFPKHYLEKIGYDNDRDRNQIANFTYLDYTTNIDISDAPPVEYVTRYREKLGEEGYKRTCAQNALPENFEKLTYPEFLSQRRLLMAQIVKKAYNELNK